MTHLKTTAENIFPTELARIKDFNIRYFVTQVFDRLCPNYFWYIPASQRCHHIPISRTRGGLVHHTKLAVKFAHSFMEMWPAAKPTYIPETYDEVIAAVLMHDMMKRGKVEDELETFASHKLANSAHGIYCAEEIRLLWLAEYVELVPAERAVRIIAAVHNHMGQWTNGYLHNDDIVCTTTHLADYAASRSLHKWIGERYIDETMGYLS